MGKTSSRTNIGISKKDTAWREREREQNSLISGNDWLEVIENIRDASNKVVLAWHLSIWWLHCVWKTTEEHLRRWITNYAIILHISDGHFVIINTQAYTENSKFLSSKQHCIKNYWRTYTIRLHILLRFRNLKEDEFHHLPSLTSGHNPFFCTISDIQKMFSISIPPSNASQEHRMQMTIVATNFRSQSNNFASLRWICSNMCDHITVEYVERNVSLKIFKLEMSLQKANYVTKESKHSKDTSKPTSFRSSSVRFSRLL